MVAGDDDRAAFAFFGSTTAVPRMTELSPVSGIVHVATTYDGGNSWLISDATPNDPIQRNGIHLGGGSPPHRNLLDFIGIDIDKQGRVLVGYDDGCTGPGCVQAPNTATGNAYTALASIARQTGGACGCLPHPANQTVRLSRARPPSPLGATAVLPT